MYTCANKYMYFLILLKIIKQIIKQIKIKQIIRIIIRFIFFLKENKTSLNPYPFLYFLQRENSEKVEK
jgi:hypothetical protein